MQDIKSVSSLGGPLPSSSSSSIEVFTGSEKVVCELEDVGKGRILSDAGMINRIAAINVSSRRQWEEMRCQM